MTFTRCSAAWCTLSGLVMGYESEETSFAIIPQGGKTTQSTVHDYAGQTWSNEKDVRCELIGSLVVWFIWWA